MVHASPIKWKEAKRHSHCTHLIGHLVDCCALLSFMSLCKLNSPSPTMVSNQSPGSALGQVTDFGTILARMIEQSNNKFKLITQFLCALGMNNWCLEQNLDYIHTEVNTNCMDQALTIETQ